MRIARVAQGTRQGVAVATNEGVRAIFTPGADLDAAVQGEQVAALATLIEADGETFEEDQLAFLPVLSRPRKIICLGLNYADHAAEGGFARTELPTLFARFPSSLIGHRQPMIRPQVSDQLDYEGELAVILSRAGRHLDPRNALDHVFGYSVFNDGSIRDYQNKTTQWTVGKNFDGTGALGPWLVTADELPSGASGLSIETRLNGQSVQKSTTEFMIFGVAETIALLSQVLTLEAGDVIAMGTPSGVGFVRKPPLFMKPGDLVEVEIERVGLLQNPVAAE